MIIMLTSYVQALCPQGETSTKSPGEKSYVRVWTEVEYAPNRSGGTV
jgi:hypothetical protein